MGEKRAKRRPAHVVTGREGEHVARLYLEGLGYRILGCNIRVGPHDEIDLVAFDPEDNVLAFVEVKTRSKADTDYRPDLNVTPAKKAAMSRAARQWIAEHDWEGGYRLDAVFVAAGRVTEYLRELTWSSRNAG